MKYIPGYEGLYAATEDGRIFSCKTNKFLKTRKDRYGYLVIDLYKGGARKTCKVHRLIALTYLENPLNLPVVNHRDEDKTNNNVSNLEFCDAKYNANYGTRNERIAKSRSKKITCIETQEIFDSINEAGKAKYIDPSCIGKVCKGK